MSCKELSSCVEYSGEGALGRGQSVAVGSGLALTSSRGGVWNLGCCDSG